MAIATSGGDVDADLGGDGDAVGRRRGHDSVGFVLQAEVGISVFRLTRRAAEPIAGMRTPIQGSICTKEGESNERTIVHVHEQLYMSMKKEDEKEDVKEVKRGKRENIDDEE